MHLIFLGTVKKYTHFFWECKFFCECEKVENPYSIYVLNIRLPCLFGDKGRQLHETENLVRTSNAATYYEIPGQAREDDNFKI